MFVGVVRIELHIPAAQSLKDKRQVVRSLKVRIRDRAHAAVAEGDHQELWQRVALGVAVVASDVHHTQELLNRVRQVVEQAYEAQLLDWQERIE